MLELSGNNAQIAVDTERGGRLASLQVFGHELLVPISPDPLHWGCYPMAPWAGRIRRGRFSHAGVPYTLPITLGAHAIHGTVWNRPWEVIDEQTLRISLGEAWPFPGYAQQQFFLTDEFLRLRLSVHALEQPFPAVIGWHPWFRRDIGAGSNVHLHFEARSMYEVDHEKIPTGALCLPSAGPWDDCFSDIAGATTIDWPGVLSLTLRSSLDHWVVYDQPAHALCVEPMSGPPDALNLGATLVTPDQPLQGEFELEWRRLNGRADDP